MHAVGQYVDPISIDSIILQDVQVKITNQYAPVNDCSFLITSSLFLQKTFEILFLIGYAIMLLLCIILAVNWDDIIVIPDFLPSVTSIFY